MPDKAARQIRDKAVFALLCLTGIRVAALDSLRISHIDLAEKSVDQNPREVATKFGKRINSFFEKSFEEAEVTMSAWMEHPDDAELYGPDDPLFPATVLSSEANT